MNSIQSLISEWPLILRIAALTGMAVVIHFVVALVRRLTHLLLRGDEDDRRVAEKTALTLMQSAEQQFAGILMTEPSNEGRQVLESGRAGLLWPLSR